MGTQTTSLNAFLRSITQHRRVIVLGGLGVIGHGLSRSTKDADIWLEPMDSPIDWAATLWQQVDRFPGLTIHGLPGWLEVTPDELAKSIDEVGMVRILGLSCPLDVFRRPNNLEEHDFDEAYAHSTPAEDGTVLMSEMHLIVTKSDTGRRQDQHDILFLEGKIRSEMSAALPTATPELAEVLFSRYLDHAVLLAALGNPHPSVQQRAAQLLRELAASGDPFAADAVRDLPPL